MNAIIGKKIAQKQAFLIDGTRIPVTVISVLDNAVLAIKNTERDGYSAVQLGYGARKKSSKSLLGHVKKANITAAPILIREIRVNADEALPSVGDLISPETVLKAGDIVKVTGTSKGKGFAGVVKRHNFRGGPRTHGQSDRERAPGSIGQTTTPGRVYRGKRMAGRMGNEVSSALNLQIVDIDTKGASKTILIKGLVPGSVNSLVVIQKTGELPEKKIVALLKKSDSAVIETVNENSEEIEQVASGQTEVAQEKPVEDTAVTPVEAETSVNKEGNN